MLGAIAGDIIGSVFERHNLKSTRFELFDRFSRFTDDTVLTVATADALLTDGDFAAAYRRWYRRHPTRGYGARFRRWAGNENHGPYNSYGNGSAMRVSPVAWVFDDVDAVRRAAGRSADVTHNHPEGIKGARAVAHAVWLARSRHDKEAIRETITREYGYDLDRNVDAIRPGYRFDVSCRGSVPEAIIAFLDSTDFEDAVRKAVSIGGDSDTIACIAGSVAEAFYGGVPSHIEVEVFSRLSEDLRDVTERFRDRYLRRVDGRQDSAWPSHLEEPSCPTT